MLTLGNTDLQNDDNACMFEILKESELLLFLICPDIIWK